ncbi:hypothetical protein BJX70DRAFT_124139 [Aspergillus crustosus]
MYDPSYFTQTRAFHEACVGIEQPTSLSPFESPVERCNICCVSLRDCELGVYSVHTKGEVAKSLAIIVFEVSSWNKLEAPLRRAKQWLDRADQHNSAGQPSVSLNTCSQHQRPQASTNTTRPLPCHSFGPSNCLQSFIRLLAFLDSCIERLCYFRLFSFLLSLFSTFYWFYFFHIP